MPASDSLPQRIAALDADGVHGATWLAKEAVRILGASAAARNPDWAANLTQLARLLAGAKPAMAAVANGPDRLLGRLLALGADTGMRQGAALAEEEVRAIEQGAEGAAAEAARLIPPGGVVATCSRSSAVVAAVLGAASLDRAPSVVALASGGHGARLATDLAAGEVPVEVVRDEAVEIAAGRGRIGLVGADSVTPDGVVNGSPTLALAKACQGRIPIYAVAQRLAFSRRARPEEGFDLAPLDLFAGVACEEGVLPPDEAAALA